MNPRVQLFQRLMSCGLLDDDRLLSACLESELEPVSFLASKELFTEQQALEALAESLGLPFVNLRAPEVAARVEWPSFQRESLPDILIRTKTLPLWVVDDEFEVAFANPFDVQTKKLLEFEFNHPISVVLAEERGITQLIKRFFPSDGNLVEILELPREPEELPVTELAKLGSVDENSAPVVKLCNRLLSDAAEGRASDIHLEPTEKHLDVRYRVDGQMRAVVEIPRALQSQVISRMKLLAGMDISERRRPQDGRFHIAIDRRKIDVRVSSLPTSFGEKLVIRLLGTDLGLLKLAKLGLSSTVRRELTSAIKRQDGMVLVCGPTGSGKTTTLYACLGELNDGSRNITTLEDPIEYRLVGLNQVQVEKKIDVNFANTLRSVLRQDPDVIMIGEIRDEETASLAASAAETGHLVLSTLHTNDAPSTIFRLRNLGLKPYQIASSLRVVVAQRLLRTLCTHCSKPLSAEEVEQLKLLWPEHRWALLAEAQRGQGCEKCDNTGYFGRTALSSLLRVSDRISEAIIAEASPLTLTDIAKSEGYSTLEEEALRLVQLGLTSAQEVYPYIEKPEKQDSSASVSTSSAPLESKQHSDEKLRPAKILLIEDDEDLRSILNIMLSKEAYQVREAANGQKGLEAVFEDKPDLIICDLMMPHMDGREFLKNLRSQRGSNDIPVVMLTAVDTSENECELLELGARDFLGKGSPTEVVLSRIRRALQR